jgi:RecB family exonuclease
LAEIFHFLLVPDKASGWLVRRTLAAAGARACTVVGAWGELVDHAGRAYLLAPPATEWEGRLGEAARKFADAFWSESFKADPEGTIATLGRELHRLLESLGPGKEIQPAGKSRLSTRGIRHLADLSRLHAQMDRVLPDDLAAIDGLLAADKSDATRLIAVCRKEGFPRLNPWQEALLAKLASDAGSARDPELDAVLASTLAPAPSERPKSALRYLQENLFAGERSPVKLDDSVTCLAVRDNLEAVEVAAGMAQKALAGGRKLAASDIGLLLPADGSCDAAVREVFSRAGSPLSGLDDLSRLRNLGGEAVFHFLATRRRPAPAMALAALFASPLMPWDEMTGNRLAMTIMKGQFDPAEPEGLRAEGQRMMKLLRERHDTPESLREALKRFDALVNQSEPMARHAEVACGAVQSLVEALRKVKGKDMPWEDLAALVPQAPMPTDAAVDLTREGVAVFREDGEPWRPVRILYVLGFSEGRYPTGPVRSPVFDAVDTAMLKDELAYAVETAEEGMARRRALLLRQLRSVSDRVVFLSPLRDAMGERVAPSGTASFIARLFEGIQAPEDLFLTLERESHRAKAAGLALAPPADPVVPRDIEILDPVLKVDLLTDYDGRIKPLTPSGLETLMVSPLGWFFDRLDIAPLSWAPEELDLATKGTLAHDVFEKLFAPEITPPGASKIELAVEKLLNDAMLRRAPFLLGSDWYVERRNLLKEIKTAAVRWQQFIARSGANILGVEINLDGTFESVPIRGRTDLVLSLPSGHVFVVDYKKSTSSTRRKCMENGYDIQASLYRQMLRLGKTAGGSDGLAAAIKAGAEIGVLYYMMDDQRALTDTSGWIPRTVFGVQELGSEIAVEGEQLVRERLAAIRTGTIPLNREDDAETFQRVGVKTYALEKSPLISRFMHPAPVEEEGE